MTTGIIAAVANSGTVTYTAPTDVKLTITTYGGAGNVAINGVYALSQNSNITHYIGAGQTVTLVVNNTSMIASVVEAN